MRHLLLCRKELHKPCFLVVDQKNSASTLFIGWHTSVSTCRLGEQVGDLSSHQGLTKVTCGRLLWKQFKRYRLICCGIPLLETVLCGETVMHIILAQPVRRMNSLPSYSLSPFLLLTIPPTPFPSFSCSPPLPSPPSHSPYRVYSVVGYSCFPRAFGNPGYSGVTHAVSG